MRDPSITLLCELIAIDSVNPSLVPGGAGEAEAARRVGDELRAAGLDVQVSEAAPGRPNVVGVLESGRPGRTLMLCGHLDTVGVAGMTAPFEPLERDGRVYGRGAQDMKGGLAAMLGAACGLARSGELPAGRVLVAAVADEEHASIGAEALVGKWSADAAVVTEPTGLEIAIGHKGFAWLDVRTEGRAAHGSRPEEGRDAIAMMGRVLVALEGLDRTLRARPRHPVLGSGSLHASLVAGGRELSSYADACALQYERRTLVGESGETALSEAQAIVGRLAAEDPDFRASARLTFERPAYLTPEGNPLPDRLEAALGRPTARSGMSFWTDAAILGRAGIPSVVFGPGGAGLHGLEEFVYVDDVLVCREALRRLALAFCKG